MGHDSRTSLDALLSPVLEAAPVPARLVRCGSIFWMALQDGEAPRCADALSPEAPRIYSGLFEALLGRGVYLAPSAYEVGFISRAHRPEDFERLATAVAASFKEIDSR